MVSARLKLLLLPLLMMSLPACAEQDGLAQTLQLPPGFGIEVFAAVPHARSLALGADGTVFVSNRRGASVYAVTTDSNGEAVVKEIDSGLQTPNGIAFFAGDLYVAEIGRVLRYANIENDLDSPPAAEELNIALPTETHHGWRYIGFGPDGKLYISIGAPCNVCERDADGFAQIVRMQPDGSEREVVARGVRNSVGFTWHPETDELWFTDNGRDMLGDDLPPDELNRVGRIGQHFGYPYCHGGNLLDPRYGSEKRCADYEPPVQNLGAHVAALGVKFYTGKEFPAHYQGQILIAEHGSWNRSEKAGYRVSLVRVDEAGSGQSYEPFISGWLQGQTTKGRPVDLLVMPDGSLLVSDDHNGLIYRIFYQGKD